MKDILWEEKNLTDLNQNLTKKEENGNGNTITEIPKNLIENDLNGILRTKKLKHQWYLRNKEKYQKRNQLTETKEYQKKWIKDNRNKMNASQRKYSKSHPRTKDHYKKSNLKRYGITVEDYNNLFNSQNGCCVICKRSQSLFKRAFHVDHNHVTGKVRGLLCVNCNHGLGAFQDDPQTLLAAIDYLRLSNIEDGT